MQTHSNTPCHACFGTLFALELVVSSECSMLLVFHRNGRHWKPVSPSQMAFYYSCQILSSGYILDLNTIRFQNWDQVYRRRSRVSLQRFVFLRNVWTHLLFERKEGVSRCHPAWYPCNRQLCFPSTVLKHFMVCITVYSTCFALLRSLRGDELTY